MPKTALDTYVSGTGADSPDCCIFIFSFVVFLGRVQKEANPDSWEEGGESDPTT